MLGGDPLLCSSSAACNACCCPANCSPATWRPSQTAPPAPPCPQWPGMNHRHQTPQQKSHQLRATRGAHRAHVTRKCKGVKSAGVRGRCWAAGASRFKQQAARRAETLARAGSLGPAASPRGATDHSCGVLAPCLARGTPTPAPAAPAPAFSSQIETHRPALPPRVCALQSIAGTAIPLAQRLLLHTAGWSPCSKQLQITHYGVHGVVYSAGGDQEPTHGVAAAAGPARRQCSREKAQQEARRS